MICSRTCLARAMIGAMVTLSIASIGKPAEAAGLYLSERGVRPLGRGGAFVAGADDLSAIVYNPAGLADVGKTFLLDGPYVNFSSDYTRRTIVRQTDPNTGETVSEQVQSFAPVQGSTPFLPIPTVGFSFVPKDKWTVAFGLWAPYAGIATYPEKQNGQPAPQRYSLLSAPVELLISSLIVESLRNNIFFGLLITCNNVSILSTFGFFNFIKLFQ